MIQVEDRVVVRRNASDAFHALADFTQLPKWDPGIARVRRLDQGPLALGARFEVIARFVGREVPMTYELVHFDVAQLHAELVGIAPGIRATDRITVRALGEGKSEVHWQADFELFGKNRLLTPIMRALFGRLARKAMAGLRLHMG